MKLMKNFVLILLAIALPLTAAAQMADEAEIKAVTSKYDLGLTKPPSIPFFDMSRISISHSYSLSYFSGGGISGSQGLYNGTIRYQLANPLTLTLNVGILHDPGALFGSSKFSQNATILPSGWLDWRPSENFMMSIGFETVPAYYRGGNYYYPGRALYWHDR